MTRILLAAALLCWLCTPLLGQQVASPTATAQDSLLPDSLLREAVRLATEGQGDSARATVRRRLAEMSTNDPLYPAALFAAGLVAESPDSATSYFRRLSIEYSRTDWADESLLRMAQLAYAGGDLSAAARFSERILLDYPFSDKLAQAAYWAGRSRMELGDRERGCEQLRRASETAGDDVELGNRVAFHLQRCTATEQAQDSVSPTGPAGTGSIVYTVQVAAMQSASAADDLMRRLHQSGFESHVLRDTDGLLKVRVGRFPNRADAERLVARVRRAVGGRPFVVEERR